MREIVVTISRSIRCDGGAARGKINGFDVFLFDAAVGDEIVVKKSPIPLCGAANFILSQGVDAATRLIVNFGEDHSISNVGNACDPEAAVWRGLFRRYKRNWNKGKRQREKEKKARKRQGLPAYALPLR